MKKKILTSLATVLLFTGMANAVHAGFYEYKEIDQIGSTHTDSDTGFLGAIDINNNDFLPGSNIISWTFNVTDVTTPGQATLSIMAEGIDLGEQDEVFFNGTSIGYLTNQGFYNGSINVDSDIGEVIPGITALTNSVFDVSLYIKSGLNTVRIEVDTPNWVNQIETSSLTVNPVPEPSTVLLFATGLAGLAAVGRKRG